MQQRVIAQEIGEEIARPGSKLKNSTTTTMLGNPTVGARARADHQTYCSTYYHL